jgi:Nucleotidyl transferase AbiEii toxin, Type IV TA system
MGAPQFEAMVNLGLTNSRMKDYYDIWLLSEQFSFHGETLKASIIATFKRRQTALPREAPDGLSNEGVSDEGKRAQWQAFVLRSRLDSKEHSLEKVVERVAAFVMPPSNAAAERSSFELTWAKGGPWEARLKG